ncbi:hypothetical protein ACFRAQ_10705 [Nocardia sp. NPDC056611]|uniref:hypothetical protein n=1 Tax=Nocardia sp. NPDC056611 TaxID=3345877 RepID=UPI00366E40A0
MLVKHMTAVGAGITRHRASITDQPVAVTGGSPPTSTFISLGVALSSPGGSWTGTAEVAEESTRFESTALHHQLRDRLVEELGPVSEYVFGEDLDNDYWRLPKVVITVAPHDGFILLDLVNPRFQRDLDEEGARDFMYDEDEEEDDEYEDEDDD